MSIDPVIARGSHLPPAKIDLSQPQQVRVAGQELTIFVESPPLIEAILADIRAARTRIWVETYIFFNDAAGESIAESLRERARAGLDVRLLHDAIGSSATPLTFFRRMASAGVQVHAFHSLWEALWRFSPSRILNRRNHRKLLVIDDHVAYFGGMNLVDPRSGAVGGRSNRRAISLGWRDIHVRLCGPRQGEIAESFDRSWRHAHQLPVKWRPRPYRQARLAEGDLIQVLLQHFGGAVHPGDACEVLYPKDPPHASASSSRALPVVKDATASVLRRRSPSLLYPE